MMLAAGHPVTIAGALGVIAVGLWATWKALIGVMVRQLERQLEDARQIAINQAQVERQHLEQLHTLARESAVLAERGIATMQDFGRVADAIHNKLESLNTKQDLMDGRLVRIAEKVGA